jgi:hypothetical protein
MGNPTQEPSKIILANKPRLLRSLLKRVIQNDPGLQLVAEVTDLAQLPALVDQTAARWVILSFPPGGWLPEVADLLLVISPMTRILLLATDGSRAKLKGIAPPEKEMQDISLAELMGMLQKPISTWCAERH